MTFLLIGRIAVFMLFFAAACENGPLADKDPATDGDPDSATDNQQPSLSQPIFVPSTQPRPYNPSTTLADGSEISVLVVYADNTDSHFLGVSKNLLFNPDRFSTMDAYLDWIFGRLNTLYVENSADQQMSLAHHEKIDFSDLAESTDWRTDLMFAYMNHSLASLTANQKEMMSRLRTLRDAHGADLVLYWRSRDDPSSAVNGAARMPEGSGDAFAQFTYFGFASVITMAHEIGHLETAQHDQGYESPSKIKYFVDGEEISDFYRTIMRTTDTKSASDGPLTVINRFSSASTTVSGEVACDVYIPLEVGTKVETRACRFDTESPLGDTEHDVISQVKEKGGLMAAFR